MSNKTQLQTNNTVLDALITRVNTAKDTVASLPEAGGGTGGSIDTCTVTITSTVYLWDFSYTRVDSSGSLVVEYISRVESSSTPITLTNIVTGSIIFCMASTTEPGVDITGDAILVCRGFGNYQNHIVISAANANIRIRDDV